MFLRAALVVIFLFHGGQKALGWFGGDGWTVTIESMVGLGIPVVLGFLTILSEVLVVLLLLFGFLTRLAALIVCLLMAGSLYFMQGGLAFSEFETPLFVLASALSLLFSGAGGFSIDRKISGALLPPLSGLIR